MEERKPSRHRAPEDVRRQKRKELDARRSKSRIRLGTHLEQWCNVKDQMGFHLHSDFAKFLLDSYASKSPMTGSGPSVVSQDFNVLHTSRDALRQLVIWSHDHSQECGFIPDVKSVVLDRSGGSLTVVWECIAGHSYPWLMLASTPSVPERGAKGRTRPRERAQGSSAGHVDPPEGGPCLRNLSGIPLERTIKVEREPQDLVWESSGGSEQGNESDSSERRTALCHERQTLEGRPSHSSKGLGAKGEGDCEKSAATSAPHHPPPAQGHNSTSPTRGSRRTRNKQCSRSGSWEQTGRLRDTGPNRKHFARRKHSDTITEQDGGIRSGLDTITEQHGGTPSGLDTITEQHGGTPSGLDTITEQHGGTPSGLDTITEQHGGTPSGLDTITEQHGGTPSGLDTMQLVCESDSATDDEPHPGTRKPSATAESKDADCRYRNDGELEEREYSDEHVVGGIEESTDDDLSYADDLKDQNYSPSSDSSDKTKRKLPTRLRGRPPKETPSNEKPQTPPAEPRKARRLRREQSEEPQIPMKKIRKKAPKEILRCEFEGCGKIVSNRQYLKHHMKYQHLLQKTFACSHPSCGRSFNFKKHLKEHEKLHSDKRDYICEFCARAFRTTSNLIIHRRIHTGEKPLQCEICGFTCRQKASLNWHMKKHDAESGYQFSCEICGKRFEKKDNVNAHKSKSHPETPMAPAAAPSDSAAIAHKDRKHLDLKVEPGRESPCV